MEDLFQEMREIEQANITTVPISIEKIFDFLEAEKNKVVDGYTDGYKLAILLDILNDKLMEIKTTISQIVIREVENPIKYNGFKIEQSSGGRYDYTTNEYWISLNKEIKEIEKKMQLASKVNGEIADENGEIITSAIFKQNKISYKISKTK